jgi:uncharacterized protein YpiB (UPF0302 family)
MPYVDRDLLLPIIEKQTNPSDPSLFSLEVLNNDKSQQYLDMLVDFYSDKEILNKVIKSLSDGVIDESVINLYPSRSDSYKRIFDLSIDTKYP